MPRGLLEGFEDLPPRLRITLAVEQFRQVEMHVGRVQRVEFEPGPIGLYGRGNVAGALGRLGQEPVGRRHQRVHRQVTLRIQFHRLPVLRGGAEFH